jgi:predicted RNase H-like HicB family nuclease
MIDRAIFHEEVSGGYWAEIPAPPGCATQGETMEDLVANLREAIEGYLSSEIEAPVRDEKARIMEIAV